MLGRLRCILGRHHWRPIENPERPTAAPYLVCARCGRDKVEYDLPTEGQARGLGGGIV